MQDVLLDSASGRVTSQVTKNPEDRWPTTMRHPELCAPRAPATSDGNEEMTLLGPVSDSAAGREHLPDAIPSAPRPINAVYLIIKALLWRVCCTPCAEKTQLFNSCDNKT